MTARADTNLYLDEVPTIRVHRSTRTSDRAILAIDDGLTVFAPIDVLRSTLTAALEQLDALDVPTSEDPTP